MIDKDVTSTLLLYNALVYIFIILIPNDMALPRNLDEKTRASGSWLA